MPELGLDYCDVMIIPQESAVTSRKDVKLLTDVITNHGTLRNVIPIAAANMDGVGTLEMAKVLQEHRFMTALLKHIPLDELVDAASWLDPDCTIYSMGANTADLSKLREYISRVGTSPKHICVDVANGYSTAFLEFMKQMRMDFPTTILTAGNVCTNPGVLDLYDVGVDIVKVGIGSGACCSTRTMTGVGYPQFSAVAQAAKASQHSRHKYVGTIADGGIQTVGDMCKALVAGATIVMVGGLFAGYTEGGASVNAEGQCEFYGMSSKAMQDRYGDGLRDYRASEGRKVIVPFKGSVVPFLQDIRGGIASCCTYIGAESIADMRFGAEFIRTSRQLSMLYGTGVTG